MRTLRAAVIGGGIIGVAVGRELALSNGAQVTIFEKETGLAFHQTGHNSGVVHAGLYYEPGSLKAQLCRRGGMLMTEYVQARDLPFDECGKVVVATTAAELRPLNDIFRKAVANGVPDARLIDRAALAEIEPSVEGLAAIHSPHSAITDYVAVTLALAADVGATGGTILLESEVVSVTDAGTEVVVEIQSGERQAFDLVVTCAGLQSDRVAVRSGDAHTTRIVPFVGTYFLLRPEKRSLVNGLIYPVPNARYPFLGIHLTKRVDGEVMVGPNAFLAGAREGYQAGHLSARDLASAVLFPGMWRFGAANAPAGFRELLVAVDKRAFIGEARKFIPLLSASDVVPGFRGVRAQAMFPNGRLADDFVVAGRGRIVNLRNAPSPGATSSLAIAEYVAREATSRLT